MGRPHKPRPPSRPPKKPANPKPIRGLPLDLAASSLPAWLLNAAIAHVAWAAWWI